MQPHSEHAQTGPRKKEDAMPSLIALKQPLKHFLRIVVVLLILATGFMFTVATGGGSGGSGSGSSSGSDIVASISASAD